MKQWIEALLMPSGLIGLLVVIAIALYFFRKRRASGYVAAAAALTYVLFGNGLVANGLMAGLEYEYPAAQEAGDAGMPDFMVVLTGYAIADARKPVTGQVNDASGFRVMEAARIQARNRRMRIIVSGSGEVPAIMKALLVDLGVPTRSVTLDEVSASTYDSAVNLRERLQGRKFYLVTSAGHMPRAMGVFRKQGLQPVPAPTDYLSSATPGGTGYLPAARHLAKSDLAVHEYIGLLWYRMLGRL